MAEFTRETLLLKWNTSTVRAFYVLREGYAGDKQMALKSLARSWTGSLLVVRAPSAKREFTGLILLNTDPLATQVDGATLGSDADLLAAWAATDLQVKSFGDSNYWSAEPVSDWGPQVVFDPKGRYRVQALTLVEK